MPWRINQASLPYHKALALVVLGSLLATCTASGDLAPDSFGGVDIAISVKRQLRTRTYTTNDIPNNDGGRILTLTPGSVTVLSNTIGRTSEGFTSKEQGYLDFIHSARIRNRIKKKETNVVLKNMDLLDDDGGLALDNPATATFEKFVERYLQKKNSLKSAIDVIRAAYMRSDPDYPQFLIKRLKNAYDTSGADSFGGRLYKAQLNAWRKKEPNVVAKELHLHIANPYFEPEALIIWLDYLGLHLYLPTHKYGYGGAKMIILRKFRETFGVGTGLLLKRDPKIRTPNLDYYLLDWRQALQNGANLKAYALEKLALLES